MPSAPIPRTLICTAWGGGIAAISALLLLRILVVVLVAVPTDNTDDDIDRMDTGNAFDIILKQLQDISKDGLLKIDKAEFSKNVRKDWDIPQ